VRILLLSPPNAYLENARSVPRLGLLQLGTILQHAGHDVRIVHLRALAGLVPLAQESWDWIGISATTREYPDAVAMLNFWKRQPLTTMGPPVVIGGAHASALPLECLLNGFDAAIVGEADEQIVRIVDAMVARRGDPCVSCDPVRDLDSLPIPDRTLLEDAWQPYVSPEQGSRKIGSILLSRGCPYKCAFCGPHPSYRRRGEGQIAAEIDALAGWGYEGFVVLDDLPFVNKMHVLEFCRLLTGRDWIWRCNFRPDLITRQIVDALVDAGCRRVQLGIESASQAVLDSVHKRTTPEQNGEAVRLCQDRGLAVKAMFLWGLPGDNFETAHDILLWIQRYRPADTQLWAYTPVPGSPLWNAGDAAKVTDYQTPWFHPDGDSFPNCLGNDRHTAAELWALRAQIEYDIEGVTRIDRGTVNETVAVGSTG